MLKQTAFNPLPHKHPVSDITGLDTTKYFASVKASTNLATVGNTDVYATNNWTVESNAQGVYKSASDPGVGTGYARFVVPKTGMYRLTFDGVMNTAQRGAIKLTLNSRAATSGSIGTDARISSGGEGCTLGISIHAKLTVNDVLYWCWWTDQTAGVPDMLANHFGGVNTRVTIRWVGV